MENVATQLVIGTFDAVDTASSFEALVAIFNVHSKLADSDPFGDSRRIAAALNVDGGVESLKRIIWLCEHAAGASKVIYDTHALAARFVS